MQRIKSEVKGKKMKNLLIALLFVPILVIAAPIDTSEYGNVYLSEHHQQVHQQQIQEQRKQFYGQAESEDAEAIKSQEGVDFGPRPAPK